MQPTATKAKGLTRLQKENRNREAATIGSLLSDEQPKHAHIYSPNMLTSTLAIPDQTWRPSSSHLQPTWAPQPERKYGGHGGGDHACPSAVDLAALLPLTAWAEQRRALDDVQIQATGAGSRTPAGGYGNGAARASSYLPAKQPEVKLTKLQKENIRKEAITIGDLLWDEPQPTASQFTAACKTVKTPYVPQQTAERAAAAQSGCEQHASNRIQSGATGGAAAATSAAEDPKRVLVRALKSDLSRTCRCC